MRVNPLKTYLILMKNYNLVYVARCYSYDLRKADIPLLIESASFQGCSEVISWGRISLRIYFLRKLISEIKSFRSLLVELLFD